MAIGLFESGPLFKVRALGGLDRSLVGPPGIAKKLIPKVM